MALFPEPAREEDIDPTLGEHDVSPFYGYTNWHQASKDISKQEMLDLNNQKEQDDVEERALVALSQGLHKMADLVNENQVAQ